MPEVHCGENQQNQTNSPTEGTEWLPLPPRWHLPTRRTEPRIVSIYRFRWNPWQVWIPQQAKLCDKKSWLVPLLARQHHCPEMSCALNDLSCFLIAYMTCVSSEEGTMPFWQLTMSDFNKMIAASPLKTTHRRRTKSSPLHSHISGCRLQQEPVATRERKWRKWILFLLFCWMINDAEW